MLLPHFGLFFFNDTATTEIYTLSYTTLFRSRGEGVEEPDPGELRLAGHAWSRSGILGRLDDRPEDLVADDERIVAFGGHRPPHLAHRLRKEASHLASDVEHERRTAIDPQVARMPEVAPSDCHQIGDEAVLGGRVEDDAVATGWIAEIGRFVEDAEADRADVRGAQEPGFDRGVLRRPIRPPVEGEEVDAVRHGERDVLFGDRRAARVVLAEGRRLRGPQN